MPNIKKILDKNKLYQAINDDMNETIIGGKQVDYFAPSANIIFKNRTGIEQTFINICCDKDQINTLGKEEKIVGNKISIRSGEIESTFESLDHGIKIERVFHSKNIKDVKYKIVSSSDVTFELQQKDALLANQAYIILEL